MIRCVLKDINKNELGITMCHEHFIVDLDQVRHDGISKIETVDEVLPEIHKMQKLGVKSAVEVTTIDLKRDVIKLREISQKTGLNIICATGYYLSEFHPAFLNDLSAEEVSEIYIKELTQGIDDTGIKAGIIAEIASSPNGFIGQEKKILVAAGIASSKTNAPVSTHTGRTNAIETIETLLNEGTQPDKIIIGHQDLIDDTEYHLSLLKYGINIAFDTCGKVAYMADEIRAKNAKAIIDAGYGDHLLLSNDISRRTYFTAHGGPGYLACMNSVIPKMKQLGVLEKDINKLLVDNPARILDNEWR